MRRKVPFSNKKKKEQLKQKRALNKKLEGLDVEDKQAAKRKIKKEEKKKNREAAKKGEQHKRSQAKQKPSYLKDLKTVFEREDDDIIEKRKAEARKPITPLPVSHHFHKT